MVLAANDPDTTRVQLALLDQAQGIGDAAFALDWIYVLKNEAKGRAQFIGASGASD
jgi:hypothetical protein